MLRANLEARNPNPSAGLLLRFLAWVAAGPRTYAETMDAWRTSCPRLSVGEDALLDGLVQVEGREAKAQGGAMVLPTTIGAGHLAQPA